MSHVINQLWARPDRFTSGGNSHRWIVIHNTANTASANAEARNLHNNPGSSSFHYVLDGSEIWQCVHDYDTAWAVGAWAGCIAYVRNSDSISIEVCSPGEEFTAEEVDQLHWLVRDLMEYWVIPADHVVRHWDCHSGRKDCPAYYAGANNPAWTDLWKLVTSPYGEREEAVKVDCCIQCEPNLTDSQLWKIEDAGGGLVRLRCKRGGVLDVIGGTDKGPMKDFRDVWTHKENGTPAQAWRLLDGVDENSFMLASSIDEGYVLDAVHGPVGERGYVQMHRKQSKAVDQWAQSWRTIPWHGGGDWVGIVNAKSWMVLDANPQSLDL